MSEPIFIFESFRNESSCWQACLLPSLFHIFVNSIHVTATLRLFPGIAAATVRAFLTPPILGVILETFGAGNAPQRADLMASLKEACDRGVVIVAISQCAKGSVNDEYETGRALLEAGVVPGGDMTPEVRRRCLFIFVEDILLPGISSVRSLN
jgi:L-asparaginase/Glu-tRNA(Gln) amidotransferase subunit D